MRIGPGCPPRFYGVSRPIVSMADDPPAGADRTPAPTVTEARHLRVREDYPGDFEDLVLEVQLEHELAGFESVATTRLDRLIEGVLEESVPPTALVVLCHARAALMGLRIDPKLAGLFPCTTLVYEDPADDRYHVHHVSVMAAIRDLGFAPGQEDDVADLVAFTGERVQTVWAHLETAVGED